MKFAKLSCSVASLLACLGSVSLARAQAATSLSDVQKAYAEVDYERTRTLAAAAIQRGGGARAQTSELYLLWATAAAAVDHPDEARTAFSFAIASNPELKLERSLSPKIRAPYLEARGALSSTDARPPLAVTLRRHKQGLELELHDVLQVASAVAISTRAAESAPFVRRRFEATPTRRIPTPPGSELQLFVQVLDRYDNVLFELGTEEEPQRMVQVSSEKPSPARLAPANGPSALPYYVTSGALAVLGLAAGGVATAMYVRREDAAREWNGSGCEQPGFTRAQQCGSVDDRRKKAQYLSVGFAATGGALLVSSVVTLVLAPSTSHADVALDAGPGNLMLRLRTSL
jgi:hypothetical protein